jgi:hypothetical protein
MKVSLAELIEKRDKPDELPPGAITHLEGVLEMFFGPEEDYSIINIWIKEIYARKTL